MKSTPGPWSIGIRQAEYDVVEKYALASMGMQTRFMAVSIGTPKNQVAIVPLDESNISNARLIAAAPELLDAVKLALAACDANAYELAYRTQSDPFVAQIMPTLRDVIAKAEGT